MPGATAPTGGPAAIGADAGTFTPPSTQPAPPTTQPEPPPAGRASLSAALPHAVSLTAVARGGLVVRVRASSAGRVTATARVGRRGVAADGARAPAGAQITLRLRLSRALVKLLRRTRAKRLIVAVTLTPTSGDRVVRTALVLMAWPGR